MSIEIDQFLVSPFVAIERKKSPQSNAYQPEMIIY